MSQLLAELYPKLKPLWEVLSTRRTHMDGREKNFSVHLTPDAWKRYGGHFGTLCALIAAHRLPSLSIHNTEQTYSLLPIDWPQYRCDAVAVLCAAKSPVGFVYLNRGIK